MIKPLATLLKQPTDLITLTIAREGDQLRVNVYPRLSKATDMEEDDEDAKADSRTLNQPLTITGAPDDFETAAFVDTITQFTQQLTGLQTSLAETEAAVTAAKEATKTKGKPAAKTAAVAKDRPAPSKPASPVVLPKRPAPSSSSSSSSSNGSAASHPKDAVSQTQSLI